PFACCFDHMPGCSVNGLDAVSLVALLHAVPRALTRLHNGSFALPIRRFPRNRSWKSLKLSASRRRTHDAAESEMTRRRIDRFGMARGWSIAPAIVRRA